MKNLTSLLLTSALCVSLCAGERVPEMSGHDPALKISEIEPVPEISGHDPAFLEGPGGIWRPAPDTVYDQSDGDYWCLVKVVKDTYDGELTGQNDPSQYSQEKWYFALALCDAGTNHAIKKMAFPAALLVKPSELEDYKPSMLSLIPRSTNKAGKVGWEREFLSVENGHLFKYNVWAGKDPLTGGPKLSVDFGKRTPLYVKTKIDESYAPWADEKGNVFFKAENKLFKWDSQSETVQAISSEPKRPETKRIHAFTASCEPYEKIDPLAIVQRELRDEEKVSRMISDKQKQMIRELKLLMREKGVLSGFKKWMTNLEYETLLDALNPENPISKGVIIVKYEKGPKAGTINMEQPRGPLVCLFEDNYYLPWAYYRALKSAVRKGRLDDAKQWEDFSPEKAAKLKHALQLYPKSRVSKIFKDVLNRFLKVKDQKSWETWFEKDNKDLNIELMFDWLASLNREKLANLLKEAGIAGRRLSLIVDMYTKTDLYAGKKVKKIKKKPLED